MKSHLEGEIERLKKSLLALGNQVHSNVQQAVEALNKRNLALANQIIHADAEVDAKEVELEEACLQALALYQPVATDLRMVVSVLKINNDLERIGDLAVNIAERAQFMASHNAGDMPFDFGLMAQKTLIMLDNSLQSLIHLDVQTALNVCAMDDEVDAINREMYAQVHRGIQAEPGRIEAFLHALSASRHLERIADHATNIAEDVVYMVAGDIVRHKAENFDAAASKNP